jgi:hypothetical protein
MCLDNMTSMSQTRKMAFVQEVSLMEFFDDSDFVAKLVGYCTKPVCIVMKSYPLGSLHNWVKEDQKNSVSKKV